MIDYLKKNKRIVLLDKVSKITKEIKRKIINMAINEPEDYFDYDCYQRSLVKKIHPFNFHFGHFENKPFQSL